MRDRLMYQFSILKQSIEHLGRQGNVLRKPSVKVDFKTIPQETLQKIISSLFHALYESKFGVGLAAPMVGLGLRIIIVDTQDFDDEPPMVLINPQIIKNSEEAEDRNEGNLCLPEIRAIVLRPKSIKVRALDVKGTLFEKDFHGFLARVILHETEIIRWQAFLLIV